MIEIYISEYYNKPAFYPYMPASIFNALEQAFIDGRETARVPVADYDRMMANFISHSTTANHERNNTINPDAIRPTAIF